jgi:hypothetical protein
MIFFYKDNRDKEVFVLRLFEEVSESVMLVESSMALYTLLR